MYKRAEIFRDFSPWPTDRSTFIHSNIYFVGKRPEPQLRPEERPLYQYANDVEHPEDFEMGWYWPFRDPGSSHGPFLGERRLHFDPGDGNPMNFFAAMFDDRMFDTIALETNVYAAQKMPMQQGKYFQYLFLKISSSFFTMPRPRPQPFLNFTVRNVRQASVLRDIPEPMKQ